MFTYLSYLLHLAGTASLSCFEFFLKLNSSYFPSTEEGLACQGVNTHPLSRRRLQLTIVGFRHAHECTALLVMACQSIFSPHYLSAAPSCPHLAPPSLPHHYLKYSLLSCQTHIFCSSCKYLYNFTFIQMRKIRKYTTSLRSKLIKWLHPFHFYPFQSLPFIKNLSSTFAAQYHGAVLWI